MAVSQNTTRSFHRWQSQAIQRLENYLIHRIGLDTMEAGAVCRHGVALRHQDRCSAASTTERHGRFIIHDFAAASFRRYSLDWRGNV